jgi:hypothetical protein
VRRSAIRASGGGSRGGRRGCSCKRGRGVESGWRRRSRSSIEKKGRRRRRRGEERWRRREREGKGLREGKKSEEVVPNLSALVRIELGYRGEARRTALTRPLVLSLLLRFTRTMTASLGRLALPASRSFRANRRTACGSGGGHNRVDEVSLADEGRAEEDGS